MDPLYGGALVNTPFAKGLILTTGVGSILFHLLGRALVAPRRLSEVLQEIISVWWPLLLLGAYILAGSIYAINANEVKESFLSMGLGMLYLPLLAAAVASSDKPLRLVVWLAAIQVLAALSMLGFIFTTNHLFHESIFVAVPLGAYFLTARKLGVWNAVFGTVMILACAFAVKNTTFLMVMASLAACAVLQFIKFLRRRRSLVRVALLYFGGLFACVLAAALVVVWMKVKTLLPSGNVEYRMEMYEIVWRRFLASPVWGSWFADTSVNYFRLYKIELGSQYLPTHSDILDILGHGGLFGISLWLMAVWRIMAIGWAAGSVLTAVEESGRDLRPWRWLFVLFLVQVNAIITYAVNPPLIKPVYAFWIWGGVGMMWALHRTLTRDRPVESRARPTQPMRSAFV